MESAWSSLLEGANHEDTNQKMGIYDDIYIYMYVYIYICIYICIYIYVYSIYGIIVWEFGTYIF